MRFHTTAFFLLFGSLSQVIASGGSDWLQFRGPDGQGHSDAEGVPIEWSEQKNIRWKVAVPGVGWSSPVISGNQIWLTSSQQDGKWLHALCFHTATGELLHNVQVLTTADPGPRHPQNGYASPTPVLDGDRAYVHFGPRGTVCLNGAGEIVWKNTEFNYEAFQGAASSPILHERLLILTCDGTDHQFLVALDKHSGKTVWKQHRAHLESAVARHPPGSTMARIAKMSYSTPLIQNVDGSPQLISNGADQMAAYDLKTGQEIWWMPYVGFSQVARPSYGNELFYVVGSVAQDRFCVFAVRPGKGKLQNDQVVWQCSQGIAHVPSPLLVGKELFVIDNTGVASCLDALTGEVLWRERLGGNHDASPIEVRGRIYYVSRDGKTTVLAAGRTCQVLATNQLDGTFKASPAVAGRALFLRSDTHLYRIEEPAMRSSHISHGQRKIAASNAKASVPDEAPQRQSLAISPISDAFDMQTPLMPFFAPRVIDQVRDPFDITDADHLKHGVSAVTGTQLDRSDIEEPLDDPLSKRYVIDVDHLDPVRGPSEYSTLVVESLSGHFVVDARLAIDEHCDQREPDQDEDP